MKKQRALKAIVAERGQVTIPKVVRDKLGIVPGTVLAFELKEGKIIASKQVSEDPIARVYGCLKASTAYKTTDEYIDNVRGKWE